MNEWREGADYVLDTMERVMARLRAMIANRGPAMPTPRRRPGWCQHAVLEFLRQRENGATIREIANAVPDATRNTLHGALNRLLRDGLVAKSGGRPAIWRAREEEE